MSDKCVWIWTAGENGEDEDDGEVAADADVAAATTRARKPKKISQRDDSPGGGGAREDGESPQSGDEDEDDYMSGREDRPGSVMDSDLPVCPGMLDTKSNYVFCIFQSMADGYERF